MLSWWLEGGEGRLTEVLKRSGWDRYTPPRVLEREEGGVAGKGGNREGISAAKTFTEGYLILGEEAR